jgi:hypothetical protein
MKRNDKSSLLAAATAELNQKLHELDVELIKAMQERNQPNKAGANVKKASHIRRTMKMIKSELTRRESQLEQAQE